MKKVRKIYGVYGMMEYHAIIQIGGKSSLRVNFTEGSSTPMGVTPATYGTDNLMFQHAIEHSADFKSGRIKLVKTLPLDGEVEIAHNEKTEDVPAHTDAKPTIEAEVTPDAKPAIEAEAHEEAEGEAVQAFAVTKEFACCDDARDYFEAEFGMKRGCVALRTRESIVESGKARGVEVVFKD